MPGQTGAPILCLDLRQHSVAGGGVGDYVLDAANDRGWGDAVFHVVRVLLFAPPVRLGNRAFHAAGHPVGIQDHPAFHIARGAADGLDQRGFAPQKAFLVRVQNGHQPAFGDVQAFTQQVNPDQHVIHAHAQVADQFDAFQRFHVRVHITHAHALFVHELGQIFGHPLGQRRHQSAEASSGHLFAFGDAILHLIFSRADFHWRVDQPGRADHLFGEHAAGLLHLPVTGSGRYTKGLRAHRVPFVEPQRPVVDARRQAEAIFRQCDLAAVIPFGHRADLRHRLVAFIHE